jgi:rhamnopyranosyl-N-acetylglucosaminyl-diphospho-decaprenol beta-1,3/1,4-galactofuranosyltransferase
MNNSRIAAVVVTFNRKFLLCECLDALLRQSLRLDSIFVIDNASSDGTEAHLTECGYLSNERIRYCRLHANLGGAGGFHAGMSAAFDCGYEWLWLMDDDSEPYKDALEKMQSYTRRESIVAIANQKVDIAGHNTIDGLRLLPADKSVSADYPLVKFSSFVGLLIAHKAIERIGLPRPEFFIHDDDTEYCIRLRKLGYIALARESIVMHKEVARKQKYRRILGFTFYQEDISQFCFRYFKHRNFASILTSHCQNPLRRYCWLAGRFLCFASAVLAFDRNYRWLRIKILAKANWDGIHGRFDNSFPFRLREEIGRKNVLAGQ